MTSIKKVVAMVLAFLMIFSSMSVLASAEDYTGYADNALSIETKFFKQDASGEWVETERVAPGSSLKARVYVGTDYYSNDSTLLFFYDKDFFTYSGSGDALTVNPATDSFAQINGVTGYLNADPNLTGIVNKGYITSDYLNDYAAILVNLEVHAANESNVKYDASDWLFEIDFTVPQGVSGSDKTLFVNPDTIQNTSDRTDAIISVPKGDPNGTDADLWPMWLWDAEVTLEATPVSTESKVTFNATGGAFESDSLDSHEVTGTINSTLATHEEPIRDGYTFLGWDDASVEGETAAAQPTTFPELDLVLNAVWVKNVNITFVTGEGGTDIPALTNKTPGTEFPVISDPVRDGFTFLYWDTADGELPKTYPTEDTVYTAIWALNVTMTLEPDNGNAATVIPGYAGQEFNPSTIADPEKEGYEFMGWDPALPTQFPEASETYTAIYEKKTYTVKYYLVENGKATLKKAHRVMFGEAVSTDVLTIPEGYELNGWYTDASLSADTAFAEGTTMSAGNLSLYASYVIQTYDAVFDAAGGYFDGDTAKTEVTVPTQFDANIIAPADPVREGYVFKGWTPAVGTMDDENGKTFYATWELDNNTVVYFWNNEDAPAEDNNVYEQFSIAYKESVDIPADPTMDGYEFLYWGTTKDATSEAAIPSEMPANGLEYYAIWETLSYDVTFDANKGYLNDDTSKTTDTQNLEYKTAIVAPTAKRAGYEFKGWGLTADAKEADKVEITTVPAYNVTYYAIWAPATAAYKVEYYMQDLNGNYVIDATKTVTTTGTTEGEVTAPALTGIDGMFKLNDTIEGTKLSGIVSGDGSLVLKAYYEREKHTYTFTNTGDSTVADITEYYGATIKAPANPERKGYTWVDWSPALPDTMGTSNQTFEGQWTKNKYPVIFDANKGYLNGDRSLTQTSEQVEFEAPINQPTKVERDGYDFKGWATTATATEADVVEVPGTMDAIEGGHTFYAVWVARIDTTYTVEYYMQELDGTYVIAPDRTLTPAGETDKAATAPALTDVDGMFELDTTVEGSNVTATVKGDGTTVLKAYYKRSTHTYKFTNTGDSTIADIVNVYGAAITEPVPEKEGHEWLGWTPDFPATMGKADDTFTGNWKKLSYNVTFYANATDAYIETEGTSSKTYPVEYDAKVTAPVANRAGYILAGWATTPDGTKVDLPENMPAAEAGLSYYAIWEAQTGTPYKVEYYMQNTSGEYVLDSSKTYYGQGATDSPITAPDLSNVTGKFTRNDDHPDAEIAGTIDGSGNTVLKAYYSRNQYSFKAYVNGEEIVSESYYYDAAIPAPSVTVNDGYEWDGEWYTDADLTNWYQNADSFSAKMPAADLAIYTKVVTLDSYFTVTVNYVDQKTGNEATAEVTGTYYGPTDSIIQIVEEVPAVAAENTTYVLISDLPDEVSAMVSELKHYQYDAANENNLAFNATNTTIAGDGSTNVNVYYEPVTYTVNFVNEDGSAFDSKTLTYYANLVLPENTPDKDGHTFLGWYLGNTKVDENTKVEGDITYTAKFDADEFEIKYVYTFEGSEENIPAAIAATLPEGTTTATIGTAVDKTLPADVDGYTFEGWTSVGDVDGKVFESDVTVTGNWVAIDRSVTYVYTFEGTANVPAAIAATLPAKVEGLHIGASIEKPEKAVDGYVFEGWTKVEGAAADGTIGTSDVTVTGNWVAVDRSVTYVYTFEGNASGVPAEIAATLPAKVEGLHIGATIEKPEKSVEGYTFEGWVLSGAAADGTVGTSDVTATANWVAIDRSITYVVNGDAPDGYTAPTGTTGAHIGDSVDNTEPAAVPGYTFSGWTVTGAVEKDGGYVVGTENVTVTGTWTHNVYKVSYEFTGVVPGSAILPDAYDAFYGAEIVEPAVAPIDGYTFEGWVVTGTVVDGKVGEGNVVVKGNWKYNSVSIIYEFAGVEAPAGDAYKLPANILDAHIGQEVVVPTMTAPAGYTLVWTVSDTAVKEGDKYVVGTETVTVTGTWAYVPYKITYTVTGDIPAGYTEPADITDAHIGQVIDQTQPTAVPGYTFTGWTVTGAVGGKVGTEDVTLEGVWSLNKYSVTYSVDGDIPAGYTKPAGTTEATIGYVVDVTDPADVPGYKFSGWTVNGAVDGKVYTSDVTVTGTWSYIDYSITYTVTGDEPDGYEAPKGTTTAHIGDDVDVTLPAAVPGYTFSGWTVNGAVEKDGGYVVGAGNVTLTGSWTHNLYKVTYVFDGDEPANAVLPAEYDAFYGAEIVEPAVAPIDGYTFIGWNATGAIVDGKVGEGNVTVTGTWAVNKYFVTYITNGGTPAIEPDEYAYGAVINAPAETITRPGYGFGGWYEDKAETAFAFGTETMPVGGVTLYAKWNANPHTITFNTGVDGMTVDTINTSYGATIDEAPTPGNRDGYEFQYWYETDENDQFLFPYEVDDRDVVLNAKWYAIPVTIEYSYTGKVPSGYNAPDAVYDAIIGNTVDTTLPEEPHGYIFEGWTVTGAVKQDDGTYKVGTETTITVTGNWKYDTFTITYNMDGGDAMADTVADYNTVIQAPSATPNKLGSTFSHWIDGTGATVTFPLTLKDNMTLTAVWNKIPYTITFDEKGGNTVADITANYGDDISDLIPADDDMVRAGYTFGGWLRDGVKYTLPTEMPAENIDLVANWIADGDTPYTMKVFLMNTTGDGYDEIVAEQTPGSGATDTEVTFNAPATRKGFTLNTEKSKLTGTITADGNLVLSAYYDRNIHAVSFKNEYDADYVGNTAVNYYYDSIITAPAEIPVREGYDFAGWEATIDGSTVKLNANETVNAPDAPVEFKATWTEHIFTITYVSDGDAATVPEADKVAFGTATAKPALVPTKTGYTFDYWYEVEGTEFTFGEAMPARDITLTAAWKANDVKVTYVFDGDVPADAQKPVADKTDAHINEIIDLTKPADVYGFTFVDWTVTGAVEKDGVYVVGTEDVTVTGTWTRNSYTITFNTGDGSKVDDIVKPYETEVAAPTVPTLEGNSFGGWFDKDGNEVTFPVTLKADMALTAKWNVNTYYITYVTPADATQVAKAEVKYGENTSEPSEPQRTGYTFAGWYAEGATEKFVFGNAMPANDITLTADWTANDVKVTYSFTGNVPEDAEYPVANKTNAHIGEVIDLTLPADVAGYTFEGWTVTGAEKNDEGNYVVDTREVAVTGNWTINSYTIKFAAYDGNVLAEGKLVYNTVITIDPVAPEREGYTFTGWYATIDGEEVKFDATTTVPAGDTTFTAKYDVNNYNLKFTIDGAEVYNKDLAYGTAIDDSVIPTAPVKEGYTFMGWAVEGTDLVVEVPETMPSKALSYVAVYETHTYNVFYYVKVVDGNDSTEDLYKLVAANRLEYGATIPGTSTYVSPAEGYEFSGWYKDEALTDALTAEDKMGTTAVKLYASETAGEFEAIFNANGGKFEDDGSESKTVETIYDQNIVAPAAPVREGYEFTGWTPAVGTMDSEGKTFTANWAALLDHYSITYKYNGIGGLKDEVFYVSVDELFEAPQDPYVEGYEFEGWAPADIENPTADDVVELPSVMPAENLEYVAVFTALSANATFYEFKDTDRGPAYNTESIGYDVYDQNAYIFGQTIEMPAVPALMNTAGESIDAYYTFLHWVDDEGNTYAADAVIEMPTTAINFYPVYERVTVKLVPVEGSTTVIERGAEDSYDEWFVYGLEEGLDNADGILDSFVAVQGDGYYDVEYVTGTAVGTGAVIKVYDNFDTSKTVEEFYIIIFGDVTGDGYIMSSDTNIVRTETVFDEWTDAYLVKAADVNGDGYIMSSDTNLIRTAAALLTTINQVTGLAE